MLTQPLKIIQLSEYTAKQLQEKSAKQAEDIRHLKEALKKAEDERDLIMGVNRDIVRDKHNEVVFLQSVVIAGSTTNNTQAVLMVQNYLSAMMLFPHADEYMHCDDFKEFSAHYDYERCMERKNDD